MSGVRVLVVDDDALVRSALTMMLDGANGIRVVGEVADGADVPAALDAHAVDVVLMDLRMPRVDGITATARVRARTDPPEVVVLTTFDADEGVLRALRAGAGGFLLKDTPPAELVAAVLKVAAGEPILSPRITRRLMDRAATGSDARARARAALAVLSDREREVAAAVGRGASNGEIATELHMGVATVKAHVSSVLLKLGLGNRTQIALLAHDAELT
ncbi:response regulator transcription factor [Pseudonocardia humida]|uniref:Response regulator transcription factor n=1 Tax=Pseudonocardia humida TaxID=2800819 RepID=A0ABT1A153_9PSEU|nr:response regulator transcription factor [Pseudonocardia humida]MCO1656658.1 response regulator transcription factor [Pseudonocardia humida]